MDPERVFIPGGESTDPAGQFIGGLDGGYNDPHAVQLHYRYHHEDREHLYRHGAFARQGFDAPSDESEC